MKRSVHRSRGFSLIEGLVTVAVIAVGMVALFNFQSGMMFSGGETKARSEALQLAEGKLSQLRTQGSLAYTSLAEFLDDGSGLYAGSDAVSGTNASFTLNWTSSNQAAPDRKQSRVTVSWIDRAGEPQSVVVAGDVSWQRADLSAVLMNESLAGGGTVPSPQGEATYGDNVADYTVGSVPGTGNTNDDGSADGTTLYFNNGIWELIDIATGTVLLYSSSELTTVSGRIYVESNSGSPIVNLNDIYAGAPDISVCRTTHHSPAGEILDASNVSTYFYVSYKCYMGAGWFGNVGVVVENGALGQNDQSCVGDPTSSDSGDDDSRHPQLAFTRIYRGYEPKTDSQGNQQYDGDGDRLYLSQGVPAGMTMVADDFLLTTMNGTATNLECNNRLALNGTSEFTGNVGEYVCLSASCPSNWPVDTGTPVSTADTHRISGSIQGGYVSGIVTSDGDSCYISESRTYFACRVDDLGAGWNGYIEATPDTGYAVASTNPLYFSNLRDDTYGHSFTLSQVVGSQTLTVAGNLDVGNGVSFAGVSLSDGGACTTSASTYSCTTNAFTGSWSGTLTVSHNKTLCPDGQASFASGVITSDTTVTFSGSTATQVTKHLVMRNQARNCP